MQAFAVINPVAFELGPIQVRWYGIIIAAAIYLAATLAEKEASRKGLRKDFIMDMVFWLLPASFLGARLYYVLFELPYYLQHPGEILAIWQGGIAIYGGLIAGGLLIARYCKKEGVNLWLVLDIFAPNVLLAQAIGRWGNFTNQEAHGAQVTREFLEKLMLPNFIIDQMNINGLYYHPTFLYESIWSLIGVAGLLYIRRKKGIKLGEIALLYVAWYSLGRFFIEGMRTDSLMFFHFFRVSQVLSVLLFFGSLGLFYWRRKQAQLPDYVSIGEVPA